MTSTAERTQILEMVEAGTITPEEGAKLIQALESAAEDASTPSTVEDSYTEQNAPGVDETPLSRGEVPPSFDSEDLRKWKQWWMIPLWVGVGIIVLSGLLMFSAWSANGAGFWFLCTWFPFLLGVGVVALAWGSSTAPWIHIRVRQKPGSKPARIAISFPLPIRAAAWGLRTFGSFIPHVDATGLDEIVLALKDSTDEDAPLIINIDEGENGERVQIFIG
ncbi:MAG: hypothetical protein B6243_10415 [Anaerolineaceae bacterium 4572_5.2]|nr:MAG: hypothetical protein B6243_10415 [Anaerolineaceae bacterium 4572_5.2]